MTDLVDLSGTWRAAEASDDLRRTYADGAFDDARWEAIEVPGHWRSTPAFADSDGPLLYRRSFEAPAPSAGRRAWLVLEGLFYQGDVWLDGAYAGDTEGYFFPHVFEVTDALRERSQHVLAIEATCAPQHDKSAKRNITGVFQHWDCLDPDWNPGGIWRPVRLQETGPVRISRLRVVCEEATEQRAVVALRGELDSDAARTVTVRTQIGDTEHAMEQPLAAGTNRVEWRVTVEHPALWWPRALGDQPLCDVEVSVDDSDRRHLRTGLRRVTMHDWVLSVNGERLFVKGSNQGPTRMRIAEATAEELRGDVQLALDANLDLLRIHAHVTRAELYDEADEAGLLLWQDLPLQWAYARGIRGQAVRQAREMVDLLGHHPSIAVWCGHNEPADPSNKAAFVASMELPTWNRSILDRSVKRAIEKADGTRPVVAHSGVWPHLPQLDGTDSHLYFGWYHGDERDLPAFAARIPRMVRFVSEFGAQAVPGDATFMEPERWPDLDWDSLEHTHALQKELFDQRVPPGAFATFEAWRDASQAYQAEVIKHHVEHLRRLKYRPTGGFAQFCLADGHPAVTWSVLGHDRQPKAGYQVLADACRPVIVVADRPPAVVEPGQELALDVHAVSDLRRPCAATVVTATLSWPGGETAWRWQGDIPADDCVLVGEVRADVPDVEGALRLDLTLASGSIDVRNSYVCMISR